MRVVLDTNVFISGIFWQGNPNKVLNAWRRGEFDIVVSAPTLSELKRVLLDFEISLPEDLLQDWIRLIIENAIIVEPTEMIHTLKDDESDNRFLECATAAHADYIISGDNHLLSLSEFRGIKIISPKDFVEILGLS